MDQETSSKIETPSNSKAADETVVELTPEQLKQVVGGLNPQPLPPFADRRF